MAGLQGKQRASLLGEQIFQTDAAERTMALGRDDPCPAQSLTGTCAAAAGPGLALWL